MKKVVYAWMTRAKGYPLGRPGSDGGLKLFPSKAAACHMKWSRNVAVLVEVREVKGR